MINYKFIFFSVTKQYLMVKCSLKALLRMHEEKGYMTSDLTEDWAKTVWEKRPGALRNPPSMLVLDPFCGHVSEELIFKLVRKNCDL
jgi:hypothetical protein